MEEGWSGRLGLADISFYIYNESTTRSYCIQYSMINHNGKKFFLFLKRVYMNVFSCIPILYSSN